MSEKQILEKYISLLTSVDGIFADMKERFAAEVKCRQGCTDCCHACFSVSYIEAAVISRYLQELAKDDIDIRQDKARQQAQKVLALTEGQDNTKVMSEARIRCPMLGDDGGCAIYQLRPVTCRVYGLPTSINQKGHVCGLSGFDKGKSYPTVKMDSINEALAAMSDQLATITGQGNERCFLWDIRRG